jgi:hypothetical protein
LELFHVALSQVVLSYPTLKLSSLDTHIPLI